MKTLPLNCSHGKPKQKETMKLVFERNGKYVETSDKSGLSAEGREILETMEENEQTGLVEYNYYLVSDDTETE